VADMSFKRSKLGVTVLGGLIYAIGGVNGTYSSPVERFGRWEKVADMSVKRRDLGVLEGKI
jgi:hypothetical protein